MIPARSVRRCWWLTLPVVAAVIGFGWRDGAWDRVRTFLPGGPPEIEYPSQIDLGDRTVGEAVDSRFQIINRGGRELVVNQVTESCACGKLYREIGDLSEPIEELRLSPGERANMAVHITIRTKTAGTFDQTISFQTNDPRHPEGRITLVFRTASGGVRFLPNSVQFGRLVIGQKTRHLVDVFDRDEHPQTVSKMISSDPEHVAIRWIPAAKDKERRDDEYLLGQIEVVPNTAKPLRIDATVRIEFADPKIEPAMLQVSGLVTPRVEVSPPSMVLPLTSRDGPVFTRNCVIRMADDRPWRLEVASISPGLKVALGDATQSSTHAVRITWTPTSGDGPGAKTKTVQLRATVGEETETIEIPVTCEQQ